MLINFSENVDRKNILDRPYRGVVVDNDDPLLLGRVKCQVQGLIEGDAANLPWIQQRSATMLGGQPNKGTFFTPSIGSELEIRFPYNDVYAGFYVGFWQTKDTHMKTFDDGYPNKYGFFDAGFTVSYDNQKNEFIIRHPESATITIKPDGSVDIVTEGVAKFAGKAGTEIGDGSSVTKIKGSKVMLADGGPPVARHGDPVQGGTQSGGALVNAKVIATGKKTYSG